MCQQKDGHFLVLPRDAISLHARYMLSYVRPSQAGIALTGPDESSWFLARKLPSTYPTLCCTETWVFPKIMVSLLPFGTFVLNSGLRKFRHGKSVALSSAVELVDDTYICDNWRVVAVDYKSINCDPLTPSL